jgi:hypothetical protein
MLSLFKEKFMLNYFFEFLFFLLVCLFFFFFFFLSAFISWEGEKKKVYEHDFPQQICFDLGEPQCNLFLFGILNINITFVGNFMSHYNFSCFCFVLFCFCYVSFYVQISYTFTLDNNYITIFGNLMTNFFFSFKIVI